MSVLEAVRFEELNADASLAIISADEAANALVGIKSQEVQALEAQFALEFDTTASRVPAEMKEAAASTPARKSRDGGDWPTKQWN